MTNRSNSIGESKILILNKQTKSTFGFSITYDDILKQYVVKKVSEGSVGDIVEQINDYVLRNMDLKEILALLKEAQNNIKISLIKMNPQLELEPRSFDPFPLEFGDKLKVEDDKIPKNGKFCLIRKLSAPKQLCSHEYVISSRKESLKIKSDRIEEKVLGDKTYSDYMFQPAKSSNKETNLKVHNTFNVYDQIDSIQKDCDSGQIISTPSRTSSTEKSVSQHTHEHKMKMIPIKEIKLESCDDIFQNSTQDSIMSPQKVLKKSDSFKCDKKALNKDVDLKLEDKKINVLKYLQSIEFQGATNQMKKTRSNMSLNDRIAYFNRL